MNEITCYIDMYNNYQTINLPSGETRKYPTKDLVDNCKYLCFCHNIPIFHLFGNEEYINGILLNGNVQNYNYDENKVKVKVN